MFRLGDHREAFWGVEKLVIFKSMSTADFIATLSLIVAILSLLINLIPLWRDRARIDFSLYLAELGSFKNNVFVKESDQYAFRIVNSGRRPITVTHVGGVTKDDCIVQFWLWRLTGLFSPRMFIINDPGLKNLLKDKDGNDRTLNEGEYSSGSVQIDPTLFRNNGGMRARQFHVIDSVGRYHRLSCSAHCKLNKALDKLSRSYTSPNTNLS